MTRFPLVRPEDMYFEQRAVAQAVTKRRRPSASTEGGLGNGPFLRLLYVPGILDRIQMLGEHLRFYTALSKKIRELIILITARHVGAQFEFHVHAIEAREFGLAEEIIDAIAAKTRPAVLDPEEELIYEFCTELFAEGRVSEELFTKAEKHFGRAVILDIVATCGYYATLGTVLTISQTNLPPEIPAPFAASDDSTSD